MASSDEIIHVDAVIREQTLRLYEKCVLHEIPAYMQEGVVAHVMKGRPVGDFLTAIFANDLMEAALRADGTNARRFLNYARLLHSDVPMKCRGSLAEVKAWRKLGGLRGFYLQQLEPQPGEGADAG